jgi:hypothetical protein
MNLSPRALMRAFKAAEKAGKEVIETEIDSVSGKIELRFAKSMRRGSLQARYRELPTKRDLDLMHEQFRKIVAGSHPHEDVRLQSSDFLLRQ